MKIAQKLAVVLSVVFTMGSLSYHAPASADSPVVASTNPIYEKAEKIIIRSTTEPRLQAPMNTLLPPSPQTFEIDFPEPMDQAAVEKQLRAHGTDRNPSRAPALQWEFNWKSTSHLEAKVTPSSFPSGSYILGEYQLNVNNSSTLKGENINGAPVLNLIVQNPFQLWRYSADGKQRELLSTVNDMYSLSMLGNQDRFFMALRTGPYCECDAYLEGLYALYDQSNKQLIRYPVHLYTTYVGKGDFVMDRRGFFYEQPSDGVQVPQSDSAKRIQVKGYVHGANISKDGNYVLMAIGEETQEKDFSIAMYSLENEKLQVLAEKVAGWAPNDPAMGWRLPIQFMDDGEQVYFVLQERGTSQEVRYAYSWNAGTIQDWNPPIPKTSWSDYSGTSDHVFQSFLNDGIYRDKNLIIDAQKLQMADKHWLNNTHSMAYLSYNFENRTNMQFTTSLHLFNADNLEQKTLYTGLHTESRLLGSSPDGQWIYVNARQPGIGSALTPDSFGQGDGKLLATVNSDDSLPTAVYMEDKKLNLLLPVIIENHQLYLPLRAVMEAGGWQITWNSNRKEVTGKKNIRKDREFTFQIDGITGNFNSKTGNLPIAPKLIDGTTYLSAGILQMLGMKFEWDDGKRVLFIKDLPEAGGITYPDGSHYEGQLGGDTAHGKGKLFSREGQLIYEGMFENDKYHGQGKLYDLTGKSLYSGTFTNGQQG
jgi:hypothetical protein